jgi:hypothetical protein
MKDDALAARLREALTNDIARLEQARRGLGESMLRYVATGAPEEVLQQLPEGEDAARSMGLNDREPGPLPIAGLLDELSPAMALRYARCLEATYAQTPFKYTTAGGWESANWLEVLLFRAAAIETAFPVSERAAVNPALTAEHVERMLVADGDPPETFIEFAFGEAAIGTLSSAIMQVATRMRGFAESAVRHHAAAVPAFHAKEIERRVHALDMLRAASPAMFEAYAPQIAACLVANEKALRLAAEPVARSAGAAMRAPLQEIAVAGDSAARVRALQALWDLARTAAWRARGNSCWDAPGRRRRAAFSMRSGTCSRATPRPRRRSRRSSQCPSCPPSNVRHCPMRCGPRSTGASRASTRWSRRL